jgi:hypothetical protein
MTGHVRIAQFLFLPAMLLAPLITPAQGTQAAPPAAQNAAGNRPAFMMPPPANTALGQKAALMGTLKWNNVPDLEGSGPFPASYEAAHGGLEYVIYQPKNLAAAEAKGKLGIYVWGNGACSADAAGSRFHLTEIASHGYIVIVPGKILSGPKAAPAPAGQAGGAGMGDADDRATAEKMVPASIGYSPRTSAPQVPTSTPSTPSALPLPVSAAAG